MGSLHTSASYKQRRLYPKQNGFGLLFFVAILGAIAINLLLGPMSAVIRNDHATQQATQQTALANLSLGLEAYYYSDLAGIDNSAKTTTVAKAEAANFLALASVPRVQYHVSEPLLQNGTYYRKWVFYIPSITEESNPPDFVIFKASGNWIPCSNMANSCEPAPYVIFSSDKLHREASIRVYQTLSRVILKSQGYFKTRRIQDPQLSTVPNYFRTESNDCSYVHPEDLGCLDTYQPLATVTGNVLTPSDVAKKLQLAESDLLSPWGTVLEMSNKQDSEYIEVPYTAAFRFKGPNGIYIGMKAVQQF